MDSNKIKPRSLRLSDEVMDKLKEITADLGGNQQRAMEKLMEVYDKEQMRVSNSGLQENMDTFESYMSVLSGMYLTALQTNQDMRALVREEFKGKLESKDRIIEDLQKKLAEAEKIATGFTEREEVLRAEIDKKITENQTNQEKYESEINHYKDVEILLSGDNTDLKKQVQNLTEKNTELAKLANNNMIRVESLTNQKTDLQKQTDLLEKENGQYKKELARLEAELESLRIKVTSSNTVMEQRMKEEREKAAYLMEKALFEQEKKLQSEYEAKLNELLGKIPDMAERKEGNSIE